MATGDIQGNLERLRAQLRSVGYRHPIDFQGLKLGLPPAILPLLHHAFLGYSRHVAKYLSTHGYELYAKSDLRFMECILRFLRSEFGYRCPLTIAQIFSSGFSERKILFVHDAMQFCKRKHNELLKASRRVSPIKKLKPSDGYLKPWKHLKVKRNAETENEEFDINISGLPFSKSNIHVQKTTRAGVSSRQQVANPSEVSVDEPDFRVSRQLSPRAVFECPTSGLQLHLNEENDKAPARLRSPGHENDRPSEHFARVLLNSSSSPPREPRVQRLAVSSPKHLHADSSLPRKQGCLIPKDVDASLPRRLRSRSTSPKKTDSSPKRVEISISTKESSTPKDGPVKADKIASVEGTQVSPGHSPKRSSPMQLNASLSRNAEVFSFCYGELSNKIDEIASKLESRFGSVERSFSKSTKHMEAKFNSLENRVKLLEKAFAARHGTDSNAHHCRKHSPNLENRCGSPDTSRFPSPVQVIRDISNVHQRGTHSPTCVYTQSHLRGDLTTQELIASIKARCNRTKELLSESRRFY